MRQAGFILEAVFVIPIGTLVSLLPVKMCKVLGPVAGRIAFYLDKRDKRHAYHNLNIIYGEDPLSSQEKTRIVRRLFMNIGTAALEYLKIGTVSKLNGSEYLLVRNHEVVDRALEDNRGALVITAHFGNWAYLGSLGPWFGYDVATIIKRQHNPYTDKWLKSIHEKKVAVKCFYNEETIMGNISRHLRRNGILGIMADQRYLSKPIFVPFFGLPSATADGPAKLHLWYESPIVFAFSLKQPDGKYLLSFDGPYHFKKTGNFRKDCLDIMTFINKRYEEVVKVYPEQWLSLLTPRWG